MGLFGWGRKQPEPVAPSADRYAGKPFLKLVDAFVLKSIGALDPAQEASLVQMTPKFQQTFACAGTWEDIVIAQLGFAPEIRTAIQALWNKNQAIARQNGVKLTPMQFVEMFVANNVPGV